MNRETLDEFFAKAEDVLTNWHPSEDAMVARIADEGADLPLADSYYEHLFFRRYAIPPTAPRPTIRRDSVRIDPARLSALARSMNESMRQITQLTRSAGDSMRGMVHALDALTKDIERPVENPRERALRQRQHRNTGPAKRVGLDGHYR